MDVVIIIFESDFMSLIPEYMTGKHRECDELFSDAESMVANNNWSVAREKWQLFTQELNEHFSQEEEVLFPQFEQATGMTSGPTEVMRMEHQQVRALVQSLDEALAAEDKDSFLGLSETLMVLIQQHNMKEEMMLYPMMAQNLANGDALINGFKAADLAK